MASITKEDVQRIREVLTRITGLQPEGGDVLTAAAAESVLRARVTADEYLDLLLSGGERGREELSRLAAGLLLGHTHFYRHPNVWELLEESLPSRFQDSTVHALVAGCSTGEEAYTIAALLEQTLGSARYRVTAIDINHRALDFGARGIYPADDVSRLPQRWCEGFFRPVGDGLVRVVEGVHRRVSFDWCNLRSGLPGRGYDLVFLRNVLTYMEDAAVDDILRHIASSLAKSGLLVVAAHETHMLTSRLAVRPLRSGLPIYELDSEEPALRDLPRSHVAGPRPDSADLPYVPLAPVAEPQPGRDIPDGPTGREAVLATKGVRLLRGGREWTQFEAGLKRMLKQRPGCVALDLSSVMKSDYHVRRAILSAVGLLEAGGTRVRVITERPL